MMNPQDDPKDPLNEDPNALNLDEFDDIDNLDDFFEDEGESGADVFEAPDEDGDVAPVAPRHSQVSTGGGFAAAKRILSTVVVVSLLGGGAYVAYSSPAVKSLIGDLVGVDFASKNTGAQLQPSGDNPFDSNIQYDDAMQSADQSAIMGYKGNDAANDVPLDSVDDQFMAAPSGMNDFDALPSPSPVTNQGADNIVALDELDLPQPVSKGDETASQQPVATPPVATPSDNIFDFDSVADAGMENEPVPMPVQVPVEEKSPPKIAMPAAQRPQPQAQPQPQPQPVQESFTPATTAATTMDLPSFGQKDTPSKTVKPAATPTQPAAKDPNAPKQAKSGFYEAGPDTLTVMPPRKPGYKITVTHGNDPVALSAQTAQAAQTVRPQSSAPVPMAPAAQGGTGVQQPLPTTLSSATITTENADDPIMVAASRAMALGRYESAMRLYQSVELRNPTYARAVKGRADALKAMGRVEEAAQAYARAEQLDPNDTEIQASLRGVNTEINPNMALNDLLMLYRRDPSNPKLSAQIGMAYAAVGDYRSSVGFLQNAVRLDPRNTAFAYNLAIAADHAGMRDVAIRAYEDTLEADSLYGGGKTINRNQVYDRLAVLRGG